MPKNSGDIFSVEIPDLLLDHLKALREGSGLSIEIIKERGYRSVLGKKTLVEAGFSKAQCRIPGLLLPIHTPDGAVPLPAYRPDSPREVRDKKVKYELPRGTSSRLDVPPRCLTAVKDPSIDLWITEGQKKADSLADHGLCAADLLGVWNFKGRNEFGGITLLTDLDHIALNGRTVNIPYDSDLMTKSSVRQALDRFTAHLQRKGARVNAVYLPNGPNGEKVGVDDYLLHHSVKELEALVEAPRPAPKAAEPVIELLDEAPEMLSKPLCLVGNYAYAATWLWTKRTITESMNKKGEIIRHNPAKVTKGRELFIIRSDGQVFEPGHLDELGLEIKLPDIPQDNKLWSTQGVQVFRSGRRPDYADVFTRVASVFNRFIDFAHSFAKQPVMCELSACASLVTWLADAFVVLGYFYANGEHGSGKTQWGVCWASTSYLGMVILSSGSFAALRDLANDGAALLFDDAEILGDPKRADPDKRNLFLAGNRRGIEIPIKEPGPNGKGWITRWVNAYCPRGFTAISLPDPVLESRSIVLPLVRTNDPRRGNADPADVKRWPCDQRALQNDLWATGLALLLQASEIWADMEDEVEVIGREFEPWRAILAVARLFERHGVVGLEGRIRDAMRAYQEEKADLNVGDRTVQTIRAMLYDQIGDAALDILDISAVLVILPEGPAELKVHPKKLTETILEIGKREGFDTDWATPRAIGWQLKKLRLKKGRDSGTSDRTRFWKITVDNLIGLGRAYGLIKQSPPHQNNVQNGHNVQNVQAEQDEVPIPRQKADDKDQLRL